MQSLPVGEEHMKLFRDKDLRRTLAILLGAPGTLAAPQEIQVVASRRVVEPDQLVELNLSFPKGVDQVDGSLQWFQERTSETGAISAAPVGPPSRLQYAGTPIERIGLQIVSPAYPGVYTIEFQDSRGTNAQPDEVIVQEPSSAPA